MRAAGKALIGTFRQQIVITGIYSLFLKGASPVNKAAYTAAGIIVAPEQKDKSRLFLFCAK